MTMLWMTLADDIWYVHVRQRDYDGKRVSWFKVSLDTSEVISEMKSVDCTAPDN